ALERGLVQLAVRFGSLLKSLENLVFERQDLVSAPSEKCLKLGTSRGQGHHTAGPILKTSALTLKIEIQMVTIQKSAAFNRFRRISEFVAEIFVQGPRMSNTTSEINNFQESAAEPSGKRFLFLPGKLGIL